MLGMETYKRKFERLANNLKNLGYEFEEDPVAGTSQNTADLIKDIEKEAGVIPKRLKDFYLTIGGINFLGRYPKWNFVEYPDPIVVFTIEHVYYEFKDFLKDKEYYLREHGGKFLIPISPDYYHKEDVSGGMWYNVPIPNNSEDPVIEDERHKFGFTKYLNHALDNGGFCALDGKGREYGYPMDKILEGVWPGWERG